MGEMGDTLTLAAMATKEESEVARIRRMGQITTTVVGKVADTLSSQRVNNQMLVKTNGDPFTIGDVKNKINLWLAELGADNPQGVIFAQGRDAGVPHSTGDNDAPLRLGQTIVFDIFPCEAGGGYYYASPAPGVWDMRTTRLWPYMKTFTQFTNKLCRS